MIDMMLDIIGGYAGGASALGIAVLGGLIKYEFKKTQETIINGSEDIKHERAVRTFESAFKTASRCLGYEIRRIQNDKELIGRPQDIAFRFNAVWLNEWKEMLRAMSGATYKGRPLELYIHSTLVDWNNQKETLLKFLLLTMNGSPTPVESLEKYLSQFKHSLEYGSLQWLDKGLLHQEEPPMKVKKESKRVEIHEDDLKEVDNDKVELINS